MKKLLIIQFEQFWRMLLSLVKNYSDENWLLLGHGMTMPMKLAYHIIHSVKYYTGDENDYSLSTGRMYKYEIERVDENSYLQREEIVELINKTAEEVRSWIEQISLDEKNVKYPWTGTNLLSVVLFIIRHNYFHLGELNALLNESIEGNAEDCFANNIY
jgi:hypothetical protein